MPQARTETTRVEMWAVAHPLRLRIFELLGRGPSTASRLARELGESSGSTSYHLRVLARAGSIVESEELGTRRERWWMRVRPPAIVPTGADAEGREIGTRIFGVFFAREDEARRRFVTGRVDAAWHEGAFVGNWFIELTADEAAELGTRMFELVLERRNRLQRRAGAVQALVSVNILPWLETT